MKSNFPVSIQFQSHRRTRRGDKWGATSPQRQHTSICFRFSLIESTLPMPGSNVRWDFGKCSAVSVCRRSPCRRKFWTNAKREHTGRHILSIRAIVWLVIFIYASGIFCVNVSSKSQTPIKIHWHIVLIARATVEYFRMLNFDYFDCIVFGIGN